ncbi:MAG: hypothetical protein ACR2MO_16510 [Acidimicrobiales bacterium]
MRNHDPLDDLRDTGHDDLADTIGAIRDRYRNQTPPSVGSQLSAFLHVGLTNDKGDLPVTAASNAYGPAPQASGPPHWRTTLTNRRQRTMQPITAFLGTIAGKLVLGTAIAAASVGGAYAAGVDVPGLPDDAETTVVVADTDPADESPSDETDSDDTAEAACADDEVDSADSSDDTDSDDSTDDSDQDADVDDADTDADDADDDADESECDDDTDEADEADVDEADVDETD